MKKYLLPLDEFAKLKNTTAAAILLRAAQGKFQLFYYHGTKQYKDLLPKGLKNSIKRLMPGFDDSFLINPDLLDPDSTGFHPLAKWEAGELSAQRELNLNKGVNIFITSKGTHETQLKTPVTISRDSLMVLVKEQPDTQIKTKQLRPEGIKQMVQMKRRDDLNHAMVFCIQMYEKEHDRTPTCKQLWNELQGKDLEEWDLRFNSKESAIIKASGIETDFESFKDKYERLFPEK